MALGMGISLLITHFYVTGSASGDVPLALPPKQGDQWYLEMLLQVIGHAFTFLVPAIFFWYYFENRTWNDFSGTGLRSITAMLLAIVIVITLIPVNQRIIDWNQNIHLPETLKEVESWMRIKEQEKTLVTQKLLQIDDLSELLVALAVFSLIGPLGEEVMFRGVLQRKLSDWGLSPVKSIWVAAMLFSLIHFQFYGLFPRLLLGALFGYLYLWSGNLWLPVLAHVVNNGLYVLTAFAHHNWPLADRYLHIFTTSPIALIIALPLSALLLARFRKQHTDPAHES